MNKYIRNITSDKRFPVFLALIILIVGSVTIFLSNPLPDEKTYLYETSIISDILKEGKWFGNDAVGTHGFLTKIPLSLLFILTGPSYIIAAFYGLFFSILSIFILHKINSFVIKDNVYSALATSLFVFSFQFFKAYNTYLRDMFVLYFLLLFIYLLIVKKEKIWIISIVYLLILDSKEYISIILFPTILIFFVHKYILFSKTTLFNRFWLVKS